MGEPTSAGAEPRVLNWLATIVAATLVTLVNLFVLTWVTRVGWLGGSAFPQPLGSRLLYYGLLNQAFVIGPLVLYQRLIPRSRRLALGSYLAFGLLFCLGSVPVLQVFLERGLFVFAGPYSIAWDVAWGAAQYVLALGLFELASALTR